jgi:hypothetical protein
VSAEQFGKLYWDVDAPLAVRAVLARVEYRCYTAEGFRPTEIIEADFEAVLGLGRTATRAAIREALARKLIARERSRRGDGRGVFVYLPLPRSESEPVTVAKRTRRVRKQDVSRSESEPDTFADEHLGVRQQDISDPPAEPVEPFVEPGEEPNSRAPARPDTPTESTTHERDTHHDHHDHRPAPGPSDADGRGDGFGSQGADGLQANGEGVPRGRGGRDATGRAPTGVSGSSTRGVAGGTDGLSHGPLPEADHPGDAGRHRASTSGGRGPTEAGDDGLGQAGVGQGGDGREAEAPGLSLDQLVLEPLAVVVTRPNPARELFDLHDRLRREALEHHGLRVTALRKPGTEAERDLLRAIGKRLREYDDDTCRHVLAVRHGEWMRDKQQCATYSAHIATWTTLFDDLTRREVGSVFGSKQPRPSSRDVPTKDAWAAAAASRERTS